MKASCALLSSVLLLAAAAAGAGTVELFHETFDGNDQKWSYSNTGERSYDKTWTEGDTVKPGYKGVKLGSTSVTGSITSESFALSNTTAAVTISIVAAAYSNTGGGKEGISVTVYDSSDSVVFFDTVAELVQHTSTDKVEIPATADYTHVFTISSASLPSSGGIHLKIESTYTKSGQRRALIGDVLVTQTVSSGLVPLDPPANLTTNNVTYTSFDLSWGSVSGATGYVVRVDGAFVASCAPAETSATVTGLAAGGTYAVAVVAQGDGVTNEDSQAATISVPLPSYPAAVAPDPEASDVTSESFSVSWTQREGETYAIRAWTLGPVDVVTEGFAGYPAVEPSGWSFNGTETNSTATALTHPVGFKNSSSIESPTYAGDIVSVSFGLQHGSAAKSTFTLYGSADGGQTWTILVQYSYAGTHISNGTKTVPVEASGIRRLKWEYEKDSGNVYLGSVSIEGAAGSGIGIGPVYLEGFGPAASNLAANATCTFEDPVAGETNYVEVTATGRAGDSAATTIEVEVPEDADAWRPVWTAPDAAAGFVGRSIDFTVSAALEGGATQAVELASGPDGATFDANTGAFSWTPAAAGATNAVFRVVNEGGTYARTVAISVEDAVRTGTLFREDFSRFVTKWDGTSNLAAITNPPPDNAGWTFAFATRAPSSLRIGKTGKGDESIGTALSPEIVLTNNLSSGTVALSFDAASYFKQTTEMHVVVLDAETDETVWTSPVLHLDAIDTVIAKESAIQTVAEGVHTNATFSVPGVPERFRLRFETVSGAADHRLYLDTIVVSQTWDASVPALPAPVPAIGEPGMDSLPVSWAAVAGATGYDLEARLADGTLAARAAGVAGTSYSFTGLADGTAYRVRIRALGDGAAAANSPWSDPVERTTTINPDRPVFAVSAGADASVEAGTAKTFSVSAARGETSVPVSYGGLSPDPAVYGSPRFAGGTFSWTPTDDDAGQTFTATFRAGGSYETNVVFAVAARPPLEAPTITNTVLDVKDAAFSWNAQSRATGYAVRLWRGSADYAKAGCFENFADCTMPKGWTGIGTGWYSGYDETRVKFDSTGVALISKLHSAPVTNLQFHVRRAGGTAGNEDSVWHLYASTGGTAESDWTEEAYESVANGISSYSFDPSLNYRRFKWVLVKGPTTDSCNMGLGDIEAFHAGAGAKFVAGFGSAAEARDWGLSTALSAGKLRADTDYYLEVTALENETEASAVLHFRTLEANKATLLILR